MSTVARCGAQAPRQWCRGVTFLGVCSALMSDAEHLALIEIFYGAFAKRDGATMASCYHADATFEDPAFSLTGADVGHMWTMLCERGKDLKITYRDVWAKDGKGGAHWDADYTFSTTGRFVQNRIDATFEFADGKILRHTDVFDFWAWTRMALGVPGVLLGRSGFLRTKVQTTAAASLEAYKASSGA